MEQRRYGWKPELPDVRDIRFAYVRGVDIPPKVDLRNEYTQIYDQGSLGSCTAQALSMAYDFGRVKQGLDPTLPSRLFIYYNERALDGTIPIDSGAYIRDGIKVMSRQGVCEEYHWPYVISRFAEKPPKQAYDDAIQSPIKQYLRLDHTSLASLRQCLALGFGFVFGFSVYDAFEGPEVARTGILKMPEPGERLRGGHAVFCVGYDDDTRMFIVRNSWGSEWGDDGHFYMPYSYMTHRDLAADFWTIRLV